VLNRLHDAGYQAYLVGGSVRDLLLDLHPKDFDVATDAHPEKVRRLFRNSRLIGKRFRLVHVFFGRENIEVATFRAHHPETSHPEAHKSHSGMLIRDNVYGMMEDDAWRRDFSINALYYNIADSSVVDYTGGMADLEKRSIRILGDPISRYKEDPVRMLRVLRFAAKLNFDIDTPTATPIKQLKMELKHIPPARLFDEVVKIFYCGHAVRAFELLRHYQLFGVLFPQTEEFLTTEGPEKALVKSLILHSCKNTDTRLAEGKTLNPAFLFAVLLWPQVKHKAQVLKSEGHRPYHAMQMAMHKIVRQQVQEVAIPRRFTLMMEEIWSFQYTLQERSKRRVHIVFSHPRFRAAYDFLVLRMQAGEENLTSVVNWWRDLQVASATQQHEMISHLPATSRNKK